MDNRSHTEQLGLVIRNAINEYFAYLDGCDPSKLHDLVLKQVQKPLLETVMEHANQNQSKAAKWLGLSRNTLRKLLAQYNLD